MLAFFSSIFSQTVPSILSGLTKVQLTGFMGTLGLYFSLVGSLDFMPPGGGGGGIPPGPGGGGGGGAFPPGGGGGGGAPPGGGGGGTLFYAGVGGIGGGWLSPSLAETNTLLDIYGFLIHFLFG